MTLPLHHCSAVACDTLVDPEAHFCAPHLRAIPVEVALLLANAATPRAVSVGIDLAMVHLAHMEGRIEPPLFPTSTPTAS